MDKKRTIEDIQQEIDNLHKKMVDRKEKIKRKQEALDFKLHILDKLYVEKRAELEQEQNDIAEDEIRKELEL